MQAIAWPTAAAGGGTSCRVQPCCWAASLQRCQCRNAASARECSQPGSRTGAKYIDALGVNERFNEPISEGCADFSSRAPLPLCCGPFKGLPPPLPPPPPRTILRKGREWGGRGSRAGAGAREPAGGRGGAGRAGLLWAAGAAAEAHKMELSAVGERVFAAESIIKRRIRKVRGGGRPGPGRVGGGGGVKSSPQPPVSPPRLLRVFCRAASSTW